MNNKGTVTLITDRLILRKYSIEDSKDMYKNWGTDKKVTRFLSWENHKNIEETKRILEYWVSRYESDRFYNWIIELKENNEAIGGIEVVELDTVKKACEIGYCLSSKYWNKGIMTEALKRVIEFLFKEVELEEIYAFHDTRNAASGEVMRKSNMTYKGTFRNFIIRNIKYDNISAYSITKKEWKDNL
ncbi:GNAT family N-acetyltransferase [Clostridium thermobutyricum]|uniref:GNAT family N-acetyltransferase n=1 Tax=Clostridium thermobutyricum TaxID=29372 RepID=UPI003F525224